MYLLQKALNTDWYILTTIVKTLKYNFYPVEFEVQHYAFLSIRLFVFEYCCTTFLYESKPQLMRPTVSGERTWPWQINFVTFCIENKRDTWHSSDS